VSSTHAAVRRAASAIRRIPFGDIPKVRTNAAVNVLWCW
jgi:hypothetical protein